MKKTLLIIVLLSIALVNTKALHFDHLMQFQFSYGIVKPLGEKDINENSFNFPSFYNNFSRGSQFSVSAIYKIRPMWSIGAEFDHISYNKWNYGEGVDAFSNASSAITRFGMIFKVHSKFKYEGIFNNLQLYTLISPFYANTKVSIEEPSFSLPRDMNKVERKSGSLGFKIVTGMNYTFARNLSAFVEGGYSYMPVESQLHNDKSLKAMHLNFGLCIHFKKSKFVY